MSKRIAVLAIALLTVATPYAVLAQGGSNTGGGDPKPVRILYVGYITNLEVTDNGVLLTVGTSYYSVATNLLLTADTNVKINGSSSSALDLEIGDYAEIVVEWPSRKVIKVEAIGTP